jgi:flagellum-specific ATP synthase
MTEAISLAPYFRKIENMESARWTGEVTELIGLLVESRGPAVAIGDFCEILTLSGRAIRTQVIGFRSGHVLSMPLEETDGLQLGDLIVARSDQARVPVGPGLMGRVLDGFGLPMDSGPPIEAAAAYDLYKAPPSPLAREHIPAALRQRAARRHLRRQRRGQEHAARRHVAAQFRRCQRDRAHRRA